VWFTKPYIFLILQGDNRKIMVKMLEMLGLVLVAIMSLGFMGILQPTIEPGLSPLFWGCAGAALMIIVYRKIKRKKEEKES
jgi:FtsH-binding integral membrane protein